jgi:hypothetical protein
MNEWTPTTGSSAPACERCGDSGKTTERKPQSFDERAVGAILGPGALPLVGVEGRRAPCGVRGNAPLGLRMRQTARRMDGVPGRNTRREAASFNQPLVLTVRRASPARHGALQHTRRALAGQTRPWFSPWQHARGHRRTMDLLETPASSAVRLSGSRGSASRLARGMVWATYADRS